MAVIARETKLSWNASFGKSTRSSATIYRRNGSSPSQVAQVPISMCQAVPCAQNSSSRGTFLSTNSALPKVKIVLAAELNQIKDALLPSARFALIHLGLLPKRPDIYAFT